MRITLLATAGIVAVLFGLLAIAVGAGGRLRTSPQDTERALPSRERQPLMNARSSHRS